MPIFVPKLRYLETGRPILSAKAIQTYSEQLLGQYFPRCLSEVSTLPTQELIELMRREDDLKILQADLGRVGAWKIRGRTRFAEKTILLDQSLFTGEFVKSLRFVLCHEIGHWLLHRHRPMLLDSVNEYIRDLEDDETADEPRHNSRLLVSTREWVEWQANYFAACLLMPKAPLAAAMLRMRKTIFQTERLKPIIFCNGTASGIQDSDLQLGNLANTFLVSKTSVKYRLTEMGMYLETAPALKP